MSNNEITKSFRRKQLLRTVFDSYIIIHHTTHPTRSLCYTQYQQKLAKRNSRRVLSTSPKRDFTNESSNYKSHSLATSSFFPGYALTIPFTHSIATTSNETQQPTRTEHLPEIENAVFLRALDVLLLIDDSRRLCHATKINLSLSQRHFCPLNCRREQRREQQNADSGQKPQQVAVRTNRIAQVRSGGIVVRRSRSIPVHLPSSFPRSDCN